MSQDTLEHKPDDELDDSLNPATRPRIDTEPGTTDMSEFEQDFADTSTAPIVGNDLRGRADKPKREAANAEELEGAEEAAPDHASQNAGDDLRERLGLGYTGAGSNKNDKQSNLYKGNSNLKKKIAIAGAATGGSLIGGILVFMALLPLKIESLVRNVENRFTASSQQAVQHEMDGLFNAYMTKHVFPYLNKGTCHTTISPGCAHVEGGVTTPLTKVYSAWKDGKLEQKLASKYGLVFGKDGAQYYMSENGHRFNIHSDNIFESSDRKAASTNAIRTALHDKLEKATLWDKTYFRFKVGKLLEKKYGIKRCLIACNTRDKFTDSVADKKLAAKALLVRRVIGPLSESYSLIMECVFAGSSYCSTSLDPANDGTEPTSRFRSELQGRLDAFAAKYGTDSLKDLVKAASDIGDKGISRYMAKAMAQKIGSILGQDVSGEAAEKAVPIVGWVLLVATLVDSAHNLGPIVQFGGYAANSSAAVQTYQAYRTAADEVHTGHVDPTELGSLTEALSTNVSGSASNQSDATSTPMYQNLFGSSGGGTAASIFGSIFGATTAPSAGTYRCDDGNTVKSGQLVCPEEKLDAGSDFANSVTSFLSDTVYKIPGMSTLLDVINTIGSVIGSAFSAAFNAACDTVDTVDVFGNPCHDALNAVGKYAAQFMNFIISKLLLSPFSGDMSGGRVGDMVIAGGDAAGSAACKLSLGCSVASTATMNDVFKRQIAEDKQQFDSMPMMARIFNTDTSYSLVSRLAMSMPTNLLTATNDGVSTLISNPVGRIASGFSSIFSGNHAFADPHLQSDAFGITQYALTDQQIDSLGGPEAQEAYWTQNCADPNSPLELSTDKMNAWYNNPANVTQDPNTGETMYLQPNFCLFLQTSTQVAGGLFDPTMLPSDSTNGTTTTNNTNTPATPTLNVQAAQNIAQQADGGKAKVGFAVYDDSGNQVAKYNETTKNYGASITKAMLLVAYLNQVGPGTLSDTAKTNLTAMIENSDNDAANWVYKHLKNPTSAVNKVASDAGMTSFALDTSDPTYVLGQSTITADDFAKFFGQIDALLPDAQRTFGLKLLSNLSDGDQTGMLLAGIQGTVYSKEGWKSEPSGTRGAPYIVNQAAQFTLGGKTYGVAITVSGTTDRQSGEALIESITQALVAGS